MRDHHHPLLKYISSHDSHFSVVIIGSAVSASRPLPKGTIFFSSFSSSSSSFLSGRTISSLTDSHLDGRENHRQDTQITISPAFHRVFNTWSLLFLPSFPLPILIIHPTIPSSSSSPSFQTNTHTQSVHYRNSSLSLSSLFLNERRITIQTRNRHHHHNHHLLLGR